MAAAISNVKGNLYCQFNSSEDASILGSGKLQNQTEQDGAGRGGVRERETLGGTWQQKMLPSVG